jgi:hypothetical protein
VLAGGPAAASLGPDRVHAREYPALGASGGLEGWTAGPGCKRSCERHPPPPLPPCRSDPARQFLLGCILERKTAADLAGCIGRPRYEQQLLLMRRCGMAQKVYLLVSRAANAAGSVLARGLLAGAGWVARTRQLA